MKTEVDNYRGYEIRFDTDNETFECDIDDSRSVKKSYASIKTFIDEFIKDNNVFKPFKVMANPLVSYGGKNGKIIGIRKDKRFIMETESGTKEQVSDYNEKDHWVVTEKLIESLQEVQPLLSERDELKKNLNKLESEIKAFYESLNATDLNEYKKQLLQNGVF